MNDVIIIEQIKAASAREMECAAALGRAVREGRDVVVEALAHAGAVAAVVRCARDLVAPVPEEAAPATAPPSTEEPPPSTAPSPGVLPAEAPAAPPREPVEAVEGPEPPPVPAELPTAVEEGVEAAPPPAQGHAPADAGDEVVAAPPEPEKTTALAVEVEPAPEPAEEAAPPPRPPLVVEVPMLLARVHAAGVLPPRPPEEDGPIESPPPSSPRQRRPHVLRPSTPARPAHVRRSALVAATPTPASPAAPNAASIPLTENQWAELSRLFGGPQTTIGSLRSVVQGILVERGLAIIEGRGEAERCRITETGKIRYRAGRNGTRVEGPRA